MKTELIKALIGHRKEMAQFIDQGADTVMVYKILYNIDVCLMTLTGRNESEYIEWLIAEMDSDTTKG